MFLKFIVAAIVSGTPLLFGTLGEIAHEKCGHLNLGVEGMMSIGACAGFMTGYYTDRFWIAILAAFAAGVLSALVYAFLTVTLMANQNVTGLTMTIFGIGLSNFIGVTVLATTSSGTLKLSEHIMAQMGNIHIPVLSDLPVVGQLLFSYDPFVYVGVAIALAMGFYYNHTKVGLNVQAIGENPAAADAAGIRVTKLKYLNIMIGGGICGIGGAYCPMIINGGKWISDSVDGLGWIAVALVIFAMWSPNRAIFGSFVFGALRVLKFYVPKSVPVPAAIYDMLPFVITALVLILTSMGKSMGKSQPAACGLNYFREER